MDAVLEPTPKERAFYYAGLPSSPKLVARSSSEPSYLRLDEWGNPICKKLHIVGDHPIIAKWNDDAPTSPRAQVVDLLSACNVDWHAIDVLRIGDLDARIASVMLFISVEPDSLSWQTGRAVAMQCRLILLHHDLPDVHCEIKESRLVPLTSPKVLQLPGHDMAMRYADRRRMLCDLVGNIISAEDTPTKQGTSCIYLREAGTNAVYALTCRHVCFGPEEEEQLIPGTALSQSSAALKKCIMQPGGGTFDKVLRDLDEFEQHHARKLEEFEQRAGIEDEDRRMRKVQFQQYSLASIQPILADFQARRQPGTRVIGQVAYVREFGIRLHGELSDWCLVRLDQSRYERPLSKLENRVFIGNIFDRVKSSALIERLPDADGTFRLQDILPTTSITHPNGAAFSCLPSLPSLLVGKCGRTTDLTFGVYNQVKSVVRRVYSSDPQPVTAVEWCVIADPSDVQFRHFFSAEGDSGACVWDMDGRIVGMITSGITGDDFGDNCNIKRAIDVTYTTPMEWILEDFRACGLDLDIV